MGPDCDVIVFADDVDSLIGRMRDDVDLGIADKEIGDDVAHGELHGCHGRGATDGAARLPKAMTNGGLGCFGPPQHRHCMTVEFLARVGHAEAPRGAIEQADPEAGLELPDAVAHFERRTFKRLEPARLVRAGLPSIPPSRRASLA